MSRNIAAREMQELIEQVQVLLGRGERLAQASGGMVSPKHFRGARTMMAMAAGDLDEKGLLLQPTTMQEAP